MQIEGIVATHSRNLLYWPFFPRQAIAMRGHYYPVSDLFHGAAMGARREGSRSGERGKFSSQRADRKAGLRSFILTTLVCFFSLRDNQGVSMASKYSVYRCI